MSSPGDFSFDFDLGDEGVPVSELGDFAGASTVHPVEGEVIIGLGERGEIAIGGGPAKYPEKVTAVEEARDATPEELEAAWTALSPAQQQLYTARPWLWAPGAPGHPVKARLTPKPAPKKGRRASRVNVLETVDRICGEVGLDPFSVMAYLMRNDAEARVALGLSEEDKVSTLLRAKCAMELASYMAPKLKSVEIKDDAAKRAQVQVFLPANGREGQDLQQRAIISLPVRDGKVVDMSPDIAAQMIREGLVDIEGDEDE